MQRSHQAHYHLDSASSSALPSLKIPMFFHLIYNCFNYQLQEALPKNISTALPSIELLEAALRKDP